ncbi:MAG TPA: c-type cytochrome [Blastocatellia bacterium]
MRKQDLTFAVVGIAAGLVLGFMVANWTASSNSESVAANNQVASVNGGGQQLPPGHPDIGGQGGGAAQSGPASQLPPGHPSVAGGGGDASAADTTAETGQPSAPPSADLPSLDPLPASNKDERTEQKYKNIQVLKGIPSERLMSIMLAFKASLGVDCTFCHVKDAWEKDDKENKQVARKMIKMVETDNQQLGGMGRVTCYTCHKGQQRPAS